MIMVSKDKAYIVANEQQEREVLYKLEQEDLTWWGGDKLTKWTPSRVLHVEFPYILLAQETFVTWSRINEVIGLEKYEIVFDGRKEEHMSEKYVVSQKFMDELEKWKDNRVVVTFVNGADISHLPLTVNDWWFDNLPSKEYNNRLIAIIRWLNGEDVFEVEKPKKWVVRSKEPQGSVDGEPLYIWFVDELTLETETEATMPPYIRRFDTKEEAESWANAHQEVVEVEE